MNHLQQQKKTTTNKKKQMCKRTVKNVQRQKLRRVFQLPLSGNNIICLSIWSLEETAACQGYNSSFTEWQLGLAPATPRVVNVGEAVTGNVFFNSTSGVLPKPPHQKKKTPTTTTAILYTQKQNRSFAPWTLQTTLLQPPWACDCLLFKGFELVKVVSPCVLLACYRWLSTGFLPLSCHLIFLSEM